MKYVKNDKTNKKNYLPIWTSSDRLSAAWVHVMAIIFASLTSKYLDLSKPDRSSSKARNSSNSSKMWSMYLQLTFRFIFGYSRSYNTSAIIYNYRRNFAIIVNFLILLCSYKLLTRRVQGYHFIFGITYSTYTLLR